jgi:hypothetical protein
MTRYPTQELLSSAGRVMGYKIEAGLAAPVFLLGSYRNVCGGCDGIPTQQDIAERILKAHTLGHVLYEGALVSASGLGGAVTQAIHPTGCDVYAFLTTPQDLCVERVIGRRAAAGNEKEFDPKNLVAKFESVWACYKNLKAEGSYDVRLLDYTDPHPVLMGIFEEFDNA